jgi:hypothetical protein
MTDKNVPAGKTASTASYYGDLSQDKFHDGWLRTGNIMA